jgi:uncharacterized protein YxeA
MKTALLIISAFIILTSCKTEIEQTNLTIQKTDSLEQIEKSSDEQTDNECDSTKLRDFKNNIQEVEYKISENFQNEIDSIATAFIKQECKKTLYSVERFT